MTYAATNLNIFKLKRDFAVKVSFRIIYAAEFLEFLFYTEKCQTRISHALW